MPHVLRTVGRLAVSGEVPRSAAGQSLCEERAAARPQERQRARAEARHRDARVAAARARLPRGVQGQVAPLEAGRATGGAPPTPSGSSATTASPSGSPRTPAATPRPRPSAAGTPAPRTRAGTRTTRARWRDGSGAPTFPSRSAWCSRWSTRTTCSATRPRSWRAATRRRTSAGIGVPLPATVDEDLRDKPTVHSLMKLGQTAYIGGLDDRAAQQNYVDFYAYLHSVVDKKIGRLLAALGDPGDPGSLRSRTVIARISDHGELGMSHGGLRQKMFNAYEESIRVPFVISNPAALPGAARERRAGVARGPGAHAARAQRPSRRPRRASTAATSAPLLRGESATRVRDAVLFTYDDHQAGTAFQNVSGQPNRIRCVRDSRWKYAVYLDPSGDTAAGVRALRPRERSRRGAQPGGQAHGPRPDQGRRAGARAAAARARARVRGQRHGCDAARCRASSRSRSPRPRSRRSGRRACSCRGPEARRSRCRGRRRFRGEAHRAAEVDHVPRDRERQLGGAEDRSRLEQQPEGAGEARVRERAHQLDRAGTERRARDRALVLDGSRRVRRGPCASGPRGSRRGACAARAGACSCTAGRCSGARPGRSWRCP